MAWVSPPAAVSGAIITSSWGSNAQSDLLYMGNTDGTSGYAGPRANLLLNGGQEFAQRLTPHTTVNGAVAAGDVTITVASTGSFGVFTTGSIRIGTEVISYTGMTATTFTGCTRGQFGTTAATHSVSDDVFYCATGNNSYGTDRWYIALGGTDTIAVAQDSANADTNSHYCCAISYLHGNSGSEVDQKLEDYWQIRGKNLTLSVRVKCSVASLVRVGIDDTVNAVSYSTRNVGTSYETLTVTTAQPIATTSTQVIIHIRFDANVTGICYLDNSILTIGSVAADYQPLLLATEITALQRYWEPFADIGDGSAIISGVSNAANQSVYVSFRFRVRKAVVPTVTKNGTWTLLNATGQPAIQGSQSEGFILNLQATAAGTFYATNSAAGTNVTAEANP